MFHNRKNRERIDHYLRGVLSEDEVQKFEADLEKDGKLSREYIAYREIMAGFRRHQLVDTQAHFKELGENQDLEERMNETVKILMRVGIFVGVAVAVLLLALAPGFLPEGWPLN